MFSRLSPLFPYLRRYWQSFLLGGLALVVYNCAKATVPLLVGAAVDDMQHGLTVMKVEHHALQLLGVAAISAVALYLTRQIIIGASREIEFDLRNDLFSHLESQPPEFFQRHRTGDIMARSTNDLNAVRQLLGPAIMYSANTLVFTALALPFMLRISPRLTLFAFLPLPFASVLVQYFGAKIHTRFERIQAMFSDISAQAEENFSGARLIRAFAQEDAQIAAFETSNQEYIRRSLMLARLMAMLWPTLEFVLGISLMITLLVGGREVVLHHISVGDYTSYSVYMVQLTWPMIAIGWVVNLVQRGAASVVRIDQLMKEKPSIDDSGADPSLKDAPIAGTVEFRDLNFSYITGAPVLHNVSLEIPAGSSLAIVGPTGSGKTTLVSLIPRLYDAAPGAVLIDGRPIAEYPLHTLRAAIGFVPQETFLFSTTIADNITFGDTETTIRSHESIVEAARTAHIATEISEFPAGFDTVVGERGLTLSGGQKQRTAIARALLREPAILILDDALASVDTYTEEQILSGLREVMQNRTTILIAHRVSTARNADRIAVLVDGRIAELGTHDELLARGGYYTDLFEKQSLDEEILTAQ
ncbi:ATP-binding cassette domain-containing protein [Granulicella sp. 5B5]|uniref:ABC transporter ATP-binding protein n=1 Tax=Granulicella sp. 5B5 TaxID=1617967 RepID=UPI0015F59BA4|nr:ABC transporter ATP-binding protein [Granulicella sp. 5B5]QMV17738.1 ATP-binding cassette domain-containing protein [Granulicella sp. 5B5]